MRKLDPGQASAIAERHRDIKADALAACIAENYGPVNQWLIDTCFVQSNAWWVSLAREANVNPPSPAAVQATLGMLAQNYLPVEVRA